MARDFKLDRQIEAIRKRFREIYVEQEPKIRNIAGYTAVTLARSPKRVKSKTPQPGKKVKSGIPVSAAIGVERCFPCREIRPSIDVGGKRRPRIGHRHGEVRALPLAHNCTIVVSKDHRISAKTRRGNLKEFLL